MGGPWFAETETETTQEATASATATTQQQASQKTDAPAVAVATTSSATSSTAAATTTASTKASPPSALAQPPAQLAVGLEQGQGPRQGEGEAFYDVQFTLSTADVTGDSSGSHLQAATPPTKPQQPKASSTVVVERVSRTHILAPYMFPPQALADFLQKQGQSQGQGPEGGRAQAESGALEGPRATPSERASAPPSRPILIPLAMMHIPPGEWHALNLPS